MKSQWKKLLVSIGIFVGSMIAFLVLTFLFGDGEKVITDFQFTEKIAIENGQPDVAETSIPFEVAETEEYVMNAMWTADEAGMLTGLMIYDKSGKVVACVSGESVLWESEEIELEAGEYTAQYYYISSDATWNTFVQEGNATTYDEAPYSFAEDGNYEMTYRFVLKKTGATNIWLVIGLLGGLIVGFVVVAVLLTVTKTDGNMEAKYDERQMKERGNGFKVGFFTHMIYVAFLILLHIAEVKLPVSEEVLMFFGILLSITVYAIYCIWKDAYISLNENATKLNVVFIVAGILNVALGVGNIFTGDMVIDGVVTFHCINLLCGIFLLILAIINGAAQAKRNAEED